MKVAIFIPGSILKHGFIRILILLVKILAGVNRIPCWIWIQSRASMKISLKISVEYGTLPRAKAGSRLGPINIIRIRNNVHINTRFLCQIQTCSIVMHLNVIRHLLFYPQLYLDTKNRQILILFL